MAARFPNDPLLGAFFNAPRPSWAVPHACLGIDSGNQQRRGKRPEYFRQTFCNHFGGNRQERDERKFSRVGEQWFREGSSCFRSDVQLKQKSGLAIQAERNKP